MTISLRSYQSIAISQIRAAYGSGVKRVLFVLPTGGGKTVVFSFVSATAASRGRRVCVLVHRQELVDQVSASLTAMGVAHGIIAGGYPETSEPVQVASVASLARRLDRLVAFDLIVADEAHHAVAGSWKTITAAMPDAFLLGVTATPERLDGRGLGDAFDHMVLGPTVAELTEAEFLVPAMVYAPPETIDLSGLRTRAGDYATDDLSAAMSDRALVGNAVEHYGRLCRGVPAFAFCCGIEHSRLVAARLVEGGFRAAHVDGTTEKEQRRALIAALGTGDLDVLTNAGLISEGVDVPAIGAAILLRPTKSLGLYLQQVGRALRPAPGKNRAMILDHAGNSMSHGLPDEARVWSLHDRPKRMRDAKSPKPRPCLSCGYINRPGALLCSTCGAELKASPEEQREIDAELVLADHANMSRRLRSMSYDEVVRWADTEEKLRQAAKARHYHHGWVKHQLASLSPP